MKIVKKVVHNLLGIAMLVVLPFIFFTLVTSNWDIIGGIKSFVVMTGSMEPTISVGSVVYTLHKDGYEKGDIISFEKGGPTITHRIVDVQTENNVLSYKTKGDANNSIDSDSVPFNKVIGKEIFRLPYLGYAIAFTRSVPGFILLVILPGFMFICFELWNIKKEIEKETTKKIISSMTKV